MLKGWSPILRILYDLQLLVFHRCSPIVTLARSFSYRILFLRLIALLATSCFPSPLLFLFPLPSVLGFILIRPNGTKIATARHKQGFSFSLRPDITIRWTLLWDDASFSRFMSYAVNDFHLAGDSLAR